MMHWEDIICFGFERLKSMKLVEQNKSPIRSSDIFCWHEKYSVDNEEIDRQHKTLFAIANNLPDEMNETIVGKMVPKLYGYVLTHLMEEEDYMVKTGYPGIAEHARIHGRLIVRLNRMVSEGINSNEELIEFKRFVHEWVSNHIIHEDKAFADYLRKKAGNDIIVPKTA